MTQKVVAVLGAGQPRMVLRSVGTPAELLDTISDDFNTPILFAREVIRRCVADRWNHDPCWILSLFRLFPAELRSEELRQRLKTPPRYGANPVNARVLSNHIPFLNRDKLRTRATVLLGGDPSPRPILLISGGSRGGKSYSYDFIDHLFCSQRIHFTPFRIKFEKADGLLFGPEELAREILMGMGVDTDHLSPSFFAKDTNNARWPQDLAGKVLTKRAVGKRYLIVLDDFSGDTLRPETAKFIDALARRIVDSSALAETFRLILIQFDRTQFTVESRKIELEEISGITDLEVTEGTREIYACYNSMPDDALLVGTVEALLAGMENDKNLPLLNERMQLLIDKLRGLP